ncbi:hypothetical protein ACPYPG_38460 [Streptomyces sp. FR-108]|uniref:hypothetical protein n=1 Tax=Streptomyces sp. FR-108 TaxID=3416665 RepID=UPI003CF98EFD
MNFIARTAVRLPPSAVDFKVHQNEQGAQKMGGAGGVDAEFGQCPPVLEVGEAVLDRCAFGGPRGDASAHNKGLFSHVILGIQLI